MEPLTETILWIAASGSFGGVILGVAARTSHKIRLPILGKLVELGFLGDALVGAGASVAFFFVAGPLLAMSLGGEKTVDDWLKVVSLGVISGLAGIKLLTASSPYILERIVGLDDRLDRVERGSRVGDLLRRAESLAASSRLDQALATYDDALKIDPHSESALLGKAAVLFDRTKWDEAITVAARALDLNPSSARGYYDRARYKNACGKYAKEDILQDLRSAVTLDPLFRNYAALHDPHFENLRHDEEFRRIVE